MSVIENPRRMYAIYRHTTCTAFGVMFICSVAMGSASWVDWRSWAVFAALAIVCEIFPVRLSTVATTSGDASLSFVTLWAAALLWGPLSGLLLGVISVVSASIIGRLSSQAYFRMSSKLNSQEPDPSRFQIIVLHMLYNLAGSWLERREYPAQWVVQLTAFNACLEAVLSCLSSLAYLATGGVLLSAPAESLSLTNFIFPIAVSLSANQLAAMIAFTIISAIWDPDDSYRKSIKDFIVRCRVLMRQQLFMHYTNYALLGPFTLILIYLYNKVGYTSLGVVVLPMYAMRYALGLSVEQVAIYRDTITTLGTYMQHYHPYTRGHLKRVADMSERVARELKLPTDIIMLMPDAGMLHDIGKVAVPESILDKVTKLTDEEWEQIKEHPVKGAEIISHLEFLDRIVTWVKYHHKWHNGSGYPDDGVKEVPIEAAIIAVADAYDAMTDDRELSLDWTCDSCGYNPGDGTRPEVCPKCGAEKHRRYRQPLSMDQAIDELRRGAGSQFHPEVVRAFLRVKLADQIERERMALDQAA